MQKIWREFNNWLMRYHVDNLVKICQLVHEVSYRQFGEDMTTGS